MAAEYPPYVNGYGGIPKLFAKIREAAVPPKFTQDFLTNTLDLKSSSYRAMIPLLKRLGFIDGGNAPTQAYKDFRDRDPAVSGGVMAERLRDSYRSLFQAKEDTYKLNRKELQDRFKSLLGLAEDDRTIPFVASTFLELSKLATWDGARRSNPIVEEQLEERAGGSPGGLTFRGKLGLSYTINLNLPATTDIDVFNAIFKSLRENLLRES
jgi:Family of unknown function (DUF5343)